MDEMLVVVAIVSLSAAMLGAIIALWVQRGYFQRLKVQQRGWERAQEGHLQDWENKQEKQIVEVEARLGMKVQHVQKAWNEWEAKDQVRVQELAAQHTEAEARMHVQNELARLPRIEEIPLIAGASPQRQQPFPHWRPALLQSANLAGLDLSHRYLGQADLRNTRLQNTSFFMADLSGALLSRANLSGADLSGANLSGADLRGATLCKANLQVADLQGAILIDADLLGARNLTRQQLETAIYDSTTLLDGQGEITMLSMPSVDVMPTDEENTAKVIAIQSMRTPVPAAEPAPAADAEASHPLVRDNMQHLTPQKFEPLLASPPAPNDNLHEQNASDRLVNTSEYTRTQEIDAATLPREYNGTKRAKVS